MARMLGRYCQGGCACRDCGDGQPDTRWRKRIEQREVARLIAEARRGTFVAPEVGLPDGFVPPSAALTPPVPEDGGE